MPAVVSFLNQKGGTGKTTLAIHAASALARDFRVLLVDADPQGSVLDWNEQREAQSRFAVVGLPKPGLHRDVPLVGQHYDWVVIDGPPRVNDLTKSAIAASDLVLIPVQPSPFDVWAAQEIVDLVNECSAFKPDLLVRFVINRLFPGTRLGAEVQEALRGFSIAVMNTVIHNRTEYAKSVRLGLTAMETKPSRPAALAALALGQEIRTLLTPADKEVLNAARG
ncbi:MAG: AAA family ATPase [Acidobacteria bacterium]|nr:AAA family ATPase [Acidobacteriota bacterium]